VSAETWARTTLDGAPITEAPDSRALTYLDSVEGTEDDAWKRALEYGDALRGSLGVPGLVVSVKRKGARLFYLYLEAS
jgi:hypothetical protein